MTIKLASELQPDSVVDGTGIRTVIWTQGCSHDCPGCHNPGTHDFNGGFEVDTDEVIEEIKGLEGQTGITFSGGDPFFQPEACAILAQAIHKCKMNVWCYTGFTFEELLKLCDTNKAVMDFLKEIDVLVDGRFVMALKSLNIKFRGSSNQRIIDVPKSLKAKKVIIFMSDDIDVDYNFGRYEKKGIYI